MFGDIDPDGQPKRSVFLARVGEIRRRAIVPDWVLQTLYSLLRLVSKEGIASSEEYASGL